jgi:hypothetical protein
MSFLEIPPPGVAPLWSTLDGQQRAEIVAMLARLIVQLGTAQRTATAARKEDRGDE